LSEESGCSSFAENERRSSAFENTFGSTSNQSRQTNLILLHRRDDFDVPGIDGGDPLAVRWPSIVAGFGGFGVPSCASRSSPAMG